MTLITYVSTALVFADLAAGLGLVARQPPFGIGFNEQTLGASFDQNRVTIHRSQPITQVKPGVCPSFHGQSNGQPCHRSDSECPGIYLCCTLTVNGRPTSTCTLPKKLPGGSNGEAGGFTAAGGLGPNGGAMVGGVRGVNVGGGPMGRGPTGMSGPVPGAANGPLSVGPAVGRGPLTVGPGAGRGPIAGPVGRGPFGGPGPVGGPLGPKVY